LDESLKYKKVDIIDVLLMVGFELVEDERLSKQDSESLVQSFKNKLEEIENIHSGRLMRSKETSTQSKGSLEAGASTQSKISFVSLFEAKTKFGASYRLDDGIRNIAKENFTLKIDELTDTLNEVISQYKRLLNNGKELLIIIDGLEKLNDIDDIFTKHIDILKSIKCFKIITMPIYLKEVVDPQNVRPFDFTMERDDAGNLNNEAKLQEVIWTRIDENVNLITQKAVKLAVEKCGGNLRYLLDIIQSASIYAMDIYESEMIGTKEIESAVEELRGSLATRTRIQIRLLRKIHNNLKLEIKEDLEDLKECLRGGLVFAYFNGNVQYFVNPIIVENIAVPKDEPDQNGS
jgi:hypothetical protein